mmetsp:Transcript_31820/g.74977  ORF Transcript_31820/g.74977 Transcript_31820/m.74977 type:complete len:85 (-) Transcript_31820:1447-1701(-)
MRAWAEAQQANSYGACPAPGMLSCIIGGWLEATGMPCMGRLGVGKGACGNMPPLGSKNWGDIGDIGKADPPCIIGGIIGGIEPG